MILKVDVTPASVQDRLRIEVVKQSEQRKGLHALPATLVVERTAA